MPVECKTVDDFNKRMSDAGATLVVVDFHATWCGPCRMMAPHLEKFQTEFDGKLIILKVDVDEVEELAQKYSIEAMPTFKLFRNGEEIETFCGANKDKLKELIVKHM